MHVTNELSRARRLGTQVALLVADVDDFKQINDQYGHEKGDRALCAIASQLRSETRSYDLCVRYAGDEFVIVLSGVSGVEPAKQTGRPQDGDRARDLLNVGPGHSDRLQRRRGCVPHDGDTFDELFTVADRRMYEDKSKRKGRPEEALETTQTGSMAPFALHRGGKEAVSSGLHHGNR